ncbi:hypothetical protein HDU67_009525 [Dinochytrium kinnereticum]|nr:hypothetical protein HDU67_009525 [Dinochytrium kinnereticum]
MAGDLSGAPVFFHVGMGGGRFVAWLLHDLGVEYGICFIVPDRPGMGLSDPWDLESFPDPSLHDVAHQMETSTTCWRGGFLDFAGIVLQIADALKIDRFGQMGMSCGCLYALAVAHRFPERLLPCSIQLFSPWIPPSLPGCNVYVRAACVVPTSVFVGVVSSALRISGDPSKTEMVDTVLGTVRWITDMLTSPFMWNRKNHQGGDGSMGDGLCSDDTDEEEGSGMVSPMTPDYSTEVQTILRTSSLSSLNTARNPTLFNRTIHQCITKLEAISYTMMNHPGISPQEAEKLVVDFYTPAPPTTPSSPRLRRAPSSLSLQRSTSPLLRKRASSPSLSRSKSTESLAKSRSLPASPRLRNRVVPTTSSPLVTESTNRTRSESLTTFLVPGTTPQPELITRSESPTASIDSAPIVPDITLTEVRPRSDSLATSATDTTPLIDSKSKRPLLALPPKWLHANVTEELDMILPRPYLGVAAVDDFLHCIERTGSIGFDVTTIMHPIVVRHGTADSMVGVHGVRGLGEKCGWDVVEYDGAGHMLFGRTRVVKEALENIVAGLREEMIASLLF